jgi:hypothetical protein
MFQHRSYSGRLFRPRPEIYHSGDNKFLIIATPWGSRDAARKTIEVANDYLSGFFRDPEATSPFPKLSNLSDSANAIRVAALLANDALYKSENKEEYKVGVELFIAVLDGEEVSYLQAGLPQVVLVRAGRTPLPIGVNFDLAVENQMELKMHPLPDEYIGVNPVPYLHIQSFKRQREDQLVLVSHSWIPRGLYELGKSPVDTDKITRALARESADQPFWVGVWNLTG